MTNPMPLNGDRLLRSAEHALTRRPSTADLLRADLGSARVARDPRSALRQALDGDHQGDTDDDTPDGTGAATKSYPSGRPQSAVDPSQGHSGILRTGPTDPLHRALERLLLNR